MPGEPRIFRQPTAAVSQGMTLSFGNADGDAASSAIPFGSS